MNKRFLLLAFCFLCLDFMNFTTSLAGDLVEVAKVYSPNAPEQNVYLSFEQIKNKKPITAILSQVVRLRLRQLLKLNSQQSWLDIPLGGLESYIMHNIPEIQDSTCKEAQWISVDIRNCESSQFPQRCRQLKNELPAELHVHEFLLEPSSCHIQGLRRALLFSVERIELLSVWKRLFEREAVGIERKLRNAKSRQEQHLIYRSQFKKTLMSLMEGVEVVGPLYSANSIQIVDQIMEDAYWSSRILIERFFERE